MNIVILTQYYFPEIGAPQARLSYLVDGFINHGHSVTVLSAMPNYPTGKIHSGYRHKLFFKEKIFGAEVIRTWIYPTQSPRFLKRMLNYLSFVFTSTIFGTIFLIRSDYLIVESPPLFLGIAAVWLSHFKNIRLVFNVSDLWPESAVRLDLIKRDSILFKMSSSLEEFCYRKAWLVTGQSKGILSDISNRFPGRRTYHLSNGADINIFHPQKKSVEIREYLNGNGNFLLVYAGLHGLAQGLEQVLDAAASLKEENSVNFILIGDGPEKMKLMKKAGRLGLKNVQFLKSMYKQEIPPILASSDAILVTLKTLIPGAVPSKIYEAMASGKPVILVAKGESAEIIRKANAGIVVEPGDISALIMTVKLLSKNSDLCRKYGRNGRRAAMKYYNRKKIISNFVYYLETNLSR